MIGGDAPRRPSARRLVLVALATLVTALLATELAAQRPVPRLTARVTDETGTLTPSERTALEEKLAAFEERKGSEIAVLIVPSTAPEAIEAYALRVAEAWKIGRGGVDDGIVLVVAKDDRKLRIEVGYGLEGAVPDALAKRIISERIVPRFYEEDYAGGLNDGVDALIGLIDGEPLPAPEDDTRGDAEPGGFGVLPFAVFFGIFVAQVFRRIFGTLFGSIAAGGGVGLIAGLITGALSIGLIAGFIVFLLALGGITRGPGRWASRGGPWGGGFGRGGFGGGRGGGFSGGGGRFGGGGASGGW